MSLKAVDSTFNDILMLHNAPFYSLDCVYILATYGRYRLIVLHERRLLVDETYNTVKAAEAAFKNEFMKRRLNRHIRPLWYWIRRNRHGEIIPTYVNARVNAPGHKKMRYEGSH